MRGKTIAAVSLAVVLVAATLAAITMASTLNTQPLETLFFKGPKGNATQTGTGTCTNTTGTPTRTRTRTRTATGTSTGTPGGMKNWSMKRMPAIVTGSVVSAYGRTIILANATIVTENGTSIEANKTIVVVPGVLWYVEPGDTFINAWNVTQKLTQGMQVKVVGLLIERMTSSGQQHYTIYILVPGLIIDQTNMVRYTKII
ncbi:MAG: hypothetical protein GXO09_00850, partial [Crenarchaeota archaeon]|nr:hypothetical protein [Thermoproteota archaeon]